MEVASDRDMKTRPKNAFRIPGAAPLSYFLWVFISSLLWNNAFSKDDSRKTLRVALTDFTTEDNAYDSLMSAKNFSAALQAELSQTPEIEWVERTEYQLAAAELNLSVLGLVNSNAALRIGKWVKADLLVLGHFTKTKQEERMLHLEIVDLDRADVLAERSLHLDLPLDRSAGFSSANIAQATKVLQEALLEAEQLLGKLKQQIIVAPLFFANLDRSRRLDSFENKLMEVLHEEVAKGDTFHLIRFPRVPESLNEAELAVMGLAESNPDAWREIADVYVWGSFIEEDSDGVPFDQVRIRATLDLWDAHHDVDSFSEAATVLESYGLAKKIARRILSVARDRGKQIPLPDAKTKIVETLKNRANSVLSLMKDLNLGMFPDKEARRLRLDRLKILEIACFLEPGDYDAQRQRIVERWRPYDDHWKTDESQESSRYRVSWQRMLDWRHHTGKFGATLQRDIPYGKKGDVDWEVFQDAAWRDLLRISKYKYLPSGYPTGVPDEVASRWHEKFSRDFFIAAREMNQYAVQAPLSKRWQYLKNYPDWFNAAFDYIKDPTGTRQMIEELWPVYARLEEAVKSSPDPERVLYNVQHCYQRETLRRLKAGIYKTYSQLGAPDRSNALLEEYPLPYSNRDLASITAAEDARSPINLPGNRRCFSVPRLDLRPPTLEPDCRWISFPVNVLESPRRVMSLACLNEELWMSIGNGAGLTGSSNDSALGRFINTYANPRVVVYKPKTQTFDDISLILGKHAMVTGFCGEGNNVWMTTQGDGAIRFDGAARKSERFGIRQGVATEDLFSSVKVGDSIFFGGGTPQNGQLCVFNLTSGTWSKQDIGAWELKSYGHKDPAQITQLGAFKNQIFVGAEPYTGGNGQLLSFDLKNNQWANLNELFRTSIGRNLVQFSCSAQDERRIWLGSGLGLTSIEPGSGIVKNWFSPPAIWFSYLYGYIEKARDLTLTHQRPINWVWPQTRMAGSVTALANDGDYLWIATTTKADWFANSDPELEGSFIYLLHKPTSKWVGQFRMKHRINAMAVSREKLWLGTEWPAAGESILMEIDKHSMLSLPESQWVSDDIPETEIRSKISLFSTREQACYAFLLGDYLKCESLLDVHDIQKADLEALAMLEYCYSPLGLQQSEKAQQCYQEIIRRKPHEYWLSIAADGMLGLKR